jgi:hypothetical protein
MIYSSRRFRVTNIESPAEMAKLLTEHTYCACNGFRIATTPWLLLNDSFSPDGAQEYAVFNETNGAQVESITASWMTREELAAFLNGIIDRPVESEHPAAVTRIPATDHPVGSCRHCA